MNLRQWRCRCGYRLIIDTPKRPKCVCPRCSSIQWHLEADDITQSELANDRYFVQSSQSGNVFWVCSPPHLGDGECGSTPHVCECRRVADAVHLCGLLNAEYVAVSGRMLAALKPADAGGEANRNDP